MLSKDVNQSITHTGVARGGAMSELGGFSYRQKVKNSIIGVMVAAVIPC